MPESLSLTAQQAAVQLTREGFTWGPLGTPQALTYAFLTSYAGPLDVDVRAFRPLTPAQQAAAQMSMAAWADLANITFSRVSGGATADINWAGFLPSASGEGTYGFAYLPGPDEGGDIWINAESDGADQPVLHTDALNTFTHELGHALGLSHPSDYDSSDEVAYYEDSAQYTVMSYYLEYDTGADFGENYASLPMLHDVAAIQRLYGANLASRTGDTIYGFNSNSDRDWHQLKAASDAMVIAIWDAGGRDTLDFSGYAVAQSINLEPGAFSDVGGLTGNVVVAFGAVIEEAIGGAGADIITGTAGANRLRGGAGVDRLFGQGGDDRLEGGDQDDVLLGGDGADVLLGGAGGDALTGGGGADVFLFATLAESSGGGVDLIEDFVSGEDRIDLVGLNAGGLTIALVNGLTEISASTSTGTVLIRSRMTVNVGDVLLGRTGVTLSGTAQAEALSGGAGADVITGGGGGDTLTGGAGGDTFRYLAAADSAPEGADLITDFSTGQDAIDFAAVAPSAVSVIRWDAGSALFVTTPTGPMTIFASGEVNGVDIAGCRGGVYLIGSTASETLIGSEGGDPIQAGAGDDVIIGGAGADALFGEAGADTFRYRSAAESTAAGSDGLFGFVSGVDRIDLSALNVSQLSLMRASGSTFLFAATSGGAFQLAAVAGEINGGDLLGVGVGLYMPGSADPDRMEGGARADVIVGDAGADLLSGGGGDDRLAGGTGNDSLTGGTGADVFLFSQADVGGVDTINDFQTGADKLDLTGLRRGAGDGLGWMAAGGSTFVFVDLGGDGSNDLLIVLAGATTLASVDVLF